MRPATLREAIERIRRGEPEWKALAEVLDTFYLADGDEARWAVIEPEPLPIEPRLDALVAAKAEYLAKQSALGRVPEWVSQPRRILDEPWFTTTLQAPPIREYLSWSSPAEFIRHNIFTDERPLRRASARRPEAA